MLGVFRDTWHVGDGARTRLLYVDSRENASGIKQIRETTRCNTRKITEPTSKNGVVLRMSQTTYTCIKRIVLTL